MIKLSFNQIWIPHIICFENTLLKKINFFLYIKKKSRNISRKLREKNPHIPRMGKKSSSLVKDIKAPTKNRNYLDSIQGWIFLLWCHIQPNPPPICVFFDMSTFPRGNWENSQVERFGKKKIAGWWKTALAAWRVGRACETT